MGWGARFAGVVVVGAVLSAAGCGAGPEGQALPAATSDSTAEPSPSVTSSPSISADPTTSASASSALPDGATDRSAQGIQIFARHWIDVANQALESGDVAELSALSAKTCKTCQNVMDDITRVYEAGGTIVGGLLTIRDSSATELTGHAIPSAEVDVSATAKKEFDKDGELSAKESAEDLTLVFVLEPFDGSWRVKELKLGTR